MTVLTPLMVIVAMYPAFSASLRTHAQYSLRDIPDRLASSCSCSASLIGMFTVTFLVPGGIALVRVTLRI